MPKTLSPELKYELELTLEAALMMAEPGTSLEQVAQRVYDAEPELVKNIQRPLTVMHFVWVLKRKRANMPVDGQMTLPGMPDLPTRMRLADGTRPYFQDRTLAELKEYRAVLQKYRSPRLRSVDRLIEVMEPYALKNRHVKIVEVIRKEQAKLAKL